METKPGSRPPPAQDFSHIPTKPFGTKAIASAPPAAAQGTTLQTPRPLQFVIRQPDLGPAGSASAPHLLRAEQLFDAKRKAARADQGSVDAPMRPSTPSAGAKRRIIHWALFGGGLLVSLLVLVVWWAAPNDELSRPISATSAALGMPADVSIPASEGSNGPPAALAADWQKPGSTKANAETTSDAQAPRATSAEPPRSNRAPNAALQRQAATRPRTTTSESAAAPKRSSVLNSVLAPRPD